MAATNRHSPIGPARFAIAVHTVVWLAKSGGVVSSSAIAEQVHSHATFLRRVLNSLCQAGLVEAREGRDGGYSLRRPAAEVTLADVFLAVKGEDCGSAPEEGGCPEEGAAIDRRLRGIMVRAEATTVDFLRKYTIENVMNGSEAVPFAEPGAEQDGDGC